ncbi:MAG TPA: hypothetical protein VFW48_06785 [Solirubrobacterales bacterium]|nr:hypothetical protein [Solirubrobacterales bacterium]
MRLSPIPPGGLTELGAAAGAWGVRVEEVLGGIDLPAALREARAENANELRLPDWPAVPARIRACLGRERADRLCDVRAGEEGDVGRRGFQEEYAEWRVVRDAAGGPVRFELTTELPEYWEVLAGHAPAVALERIGEFAGAEVPPTAVFGDHDPFAARSTERDRADAFRLQMLGWDRAGRRVRPPSPLNNGIEAIACLSRGDNTLSALLTLTAAAASPQLVLDVESGEARFPSGAEAIPDLPPNCATDCRNSDPIVVERVVRLATEGRPIRFDDPLGVYILEVQGAELLDPGGQPLPRECFKLSRQGPGSPDDLPRHQRLELEIPAAAGFSLSEVRVARTGMPIQHGSQIAELVQLGVYLRVGRRGQLPVTVSPRPAPPVAACAEPAACAKVVEAAAKIGGRIG